MAGKFSAPYTRIVVSVNWTMEAWKCGASLAMPVCLACSVKSPIRSPAASARPVAAPVVRRLSCHLAPGASVNTVGAMAASAG